MFHRSEPSSMAKTPTAARRLPQLPDQSMRSSPMPTCPNTVQRMIRNDGDEYEHMRRTIIDLAMR